MTGRDRIAGTWARPRVVWTIVAGLTLAAALVWLSLPRGGEDHGEDAAPVRTAFPEVPARSVRPQDDVDPALSSSRPSGSELIEVCGLGWVEPDASGGWDTTAAGAMPDVVASRRALLDGMRRHDGELGAAIATVLVLHEDRQATASLREQLARQAAATHDPRVYALALKECEVAPAQGSCALLNLEQWARLDDGNAVPWLHILRQAQQRGDGAQIDEALHRIGAAARLDERVFAAAGSVADHAGASDVDAVAALLLAVDAFVHAASRQTPLQPLTSVCTVATFADANRRQACDSAAATLAERSDSLLAIAVGTTLGRRLGWTDDRVDALRGLQFARAAMAPEGGSTIEPAPSVGVPNTCGGVRRVLALFSRQGRSGEVQPVRDWLVATGATIAPYARQAHEAPRGRDDRESATASAAASSGASPDVAVAQGAVSPYSEAPPPAR